MLMRTSEAPGARWSGSFCLCWDCDVLPCGAALLQNKSARARFRARVLLRRRRWCPQINVHSPLGTVGQVPQMAVEWWFFLRSVGAGVLGVARKRVIPDGLWLMQRALQHTKECPSLSR